MSQDTVDKEIAEAASEGLSFFAFYWYIDPVTGGELDVSAPIRKFFSSKQASKMQFVLAPIVAGTGFSVQTWEDVTVRLILKYMRSPSYLTIDGRPVLIDYHLSFHDDAATRAAYHALRVRAMAELHKSPFIVNLLGPRATYDVIAYRAHALSPDAFTCFSFDMEPDESYEQFTKAWMTSMLHQITPWNEMMKPPPTYFPCASTGQDPRPWYEIGWGPWGPYKAGMASRAYTTGITPELWREHLAGVKAIANSRRLQTLNMILIYAWNEWGEAEMSLEPSKKYGYRYADVVRDVFGLTPRAARPSTRSP